MQKFTKDDLITAELRLNAELQLETIHSLGESDFRRILVKESRFAKDYVVTLVDTLFGQQVHEEVVAMEEVPSTWWDAFKLRWFNSWFLRKWPPVTRKFPVVMRTVHVCPHFDLPKKDPSHFKFLETLRAWEATNGD